MAIRDRFVTIAAAELYATMDIDEPISPISPISPVFAEAIVVAVAHRVATTASPSYVRKSGVVRRLTPVLSRRIDRYIDDNIERQMHLIGTGRARWTQPLYFLRVFQETVGHVAARLRHAAAGRPGPIAEARARAILVPPHLAQTTNLERAETHRVIRPATSRHEAAPSGPDHHTN